MYCYVHFGRRNKGTHGVLENKAKEGNRRLERDGKLS